MVIYTVKWTDIGDVNMDRIMAFSSVKAATEHWHLINEESESNKRIKIDNVDYAIERHELKKSEGLIAFVNSLHPSEQRPVPGESPGERLKAELKAIGMTQKNFADLVGVNEIYINKMINGHLEITKKQAELFASALDRDPSIFLNQ